MLTSAACSGQVRGSVKVAEPGHIFKKNMYHRKERSMQLISA